MNVQNKAGRQSPFRGLCLFTIILTSTKRLAVLFYNICLFAFLSCWLVKPRSEPESSLFLYLARRKCWLDQKLPGINLLLHHICSFTTRVFAGRKLRGSNLLSHFSQVSQVALGSGRLNITLFFSISQPQQITYLLKGLRFFLKKNP